MARRRRHHRTLGASRRRRTGKRGGSHRSKFKTAAAKQCSLKLRTGKVRSFQLCMKQALKK